TGSSGLPASGNSSGSSASSAAILKSLMASPTPHVAENWQVLFILPTSNYAASSTGVYDWVALTGPTNNETSFLALDAGGHVKWELDTQSSQQYGIVRLWSSNGGYVGLTSAGVANIAQRFTTQDASYLGQLYGLLYDTANGISSGTPSKGPIAMS